MKKIIAFISVLVLTLSSFTVQVFADEIQSGDITNQVTPPINQDDVSEVLALGILTDMITSKGVSFDFSQYQGNYEDFIEFILESVGNAGGSAFNYVQEQLLQNVNNVIDWLRNTLSNSTPFTGAAQHGIAAWNILSQSFPDDSINVNPDPNYIQYINTINTWEWSNNNGTVSVYDATIYNNAFTWENRRDFSYAKLNNESWNGGQFISFYAYEKTTVYINQVDNTYIVTVNNPTQQKVFKRNNVLYNTCNFLLDPSVLQLYYYSTRDKTDIMTSYFPYQSDNLSTCLQYVADRLKNVNLYVNGDPWILVDTDTPNKIIYDENSLQYTDGRPINVIFPQGTKLNYNTLKQIIEDIINNKEVLTYSDIESVFVDYNGQQAIAVYQVNYMPDDDTINIMYPTQPNFEQFENDMSEITGNTSGVFLFTLLFNTIPPEVWGALCAGALIVLFACLIKRMLE